MKIFEVTVVETITWVYVIPARTKEEAMEAADSGTEELVERSPSNVSKSVEEILE